jgi:parvulin-like peptidyl-prolyl isomerase
VGAKAGQRGKPGKDRAGGRQRLALILFGALFLLLFVGFAIAQGLTGPSVPSGDVVHVSDVPDEIANVSEDQLKRTILRQAAGEGQEAAVPKPGTDKYEELKTKAMTELIEGIWLRGEAEELGISVTEKQVEEELATIKKQNFPTEAQFQKFLKKSRFTPEEVNDLVELQVLVKEIQERINSEAPPPTGAQIEAYYEAEKDSQFTTKESRDVRIVLNKDEGEVEAAKKELEADNSPDSWKKVATKYSSDPTSKTKGGLQEGLTEEFLQGPLKTAIFDAATNELIGPIKFQGNYIVAEVVKLNPGKVQKLAEAKQQIESTLLQESQQEFLSEFAADYRDKWSSRTVCASGFEMELCGNYKGDGRPANASPACYEADPKSPPTECPSPVTPISPALPGTVTEVKPKGEPFPQRPRPEGSGEAGEEVPVPAGVPPTGE